MATTLSLLVIFLPVVFMGGRIGQFFSSFGGTVAFSIFMSLCISFTLTPMLCSRFLRAQEEPRPGQQVRLRVAGHRRPVTAGSLAWSLRHRWAIVLATVGLLVITPGLFKIVGFDFIPRDDQSELEVTFTTPEGYTLDRVSQLCAEVESRLQKLRGVTHVFTTIGDTSGRVAKGQGDVTTGTIYLRLVDLTERQRTWYDPLFWWNGIRGVEENDARTTSRNSTSSVTRGRSWRSTPNSVPPSKTSRSSPAPASANRSST